MTEERIFFRQGDIIISTSSFIFGDKRYDARSVNAVSWKKVKDKKILGILLMIFGAALAIATTLYFGAASNPRPVGVTLHYSTVYLIRYYFSLGIGVAAIISGLILLILRKEKYVLILKSAVAEQKAFVHRDRDLLIQIAGAMNEAIQPNNQK
jgi:hypothetical protein